MSDPEFFIASGTFPTVPTSAAESFVGKTPAQMHLPGVIIFVHGVNSMGEWFSETEQGLCEGLNQRLARTPDKMVRSGVAAGCLQPNEYGSEIDEKGVLTRADAGDFFKSVGNHSPVIRFRWGYRCGPDELDTFESEVMLNRDDAWGGGPFQNGTSCLSDLWSEGLNDRLFLSINAQRLNPTSRQVYHCPSRRYMVHAAQRLADLIADIRATQPGCPITVVCHSQGNMVGTAAALLAKSPGDVADNYVLCNPPYSVEKLMMYNLANPRSSYTRVPGHGRGTPETQIVPVETRTAANRIATLKQFIERIHARGEQTKGLQPLDKINERIENTQNGTTYFKLADTANYAAGQDRDNRGKVFLYVNPHDQVIGSSSIEGIGWKGVTQAQLAQLGPDTFLQRVWAQDFAVGDPASTTYHYWQNHWNQAGIQQDKNNFWYPQAPKIKWFFENGRYDESALGKGSAWILGGLTNLLGLKFKSAMGSPLRVNNLPDADHQVPVNAPPVPAVDGDYLKPRSARAGQYEGTMTHSRFDEALDDAKPVRDGEDSTAKRELLMEDNAMARMSTAQEARNQQSGWADRRMAAWLNAAPQNATDHSTILKNPEHAKRVLAYDVAIGVAQIPPAKWAEWRERAHWRFVKPSDDPYYTRGYWGGGSPDENASTQNKTSVQDKYPESNMPAEIADRPARPQDAMAYQADFYDPTGLA